MKKHAFLVVFPVLFLAAACSPRAPAATVPPVSQTEVPMTFQLTSIAFAEGIMIPSVYTCTGRNISPPLGWEQRPAGTQSFALVVDDPDAPGGTWTHWVMYAIPVTASSLPENVPPDAVRPDGSKQGKNSWGKLGYGGPCPPSGTHRYFFRLYALDASLDLPAGANAGQLDQAMQGHVLGYAELMGTYRK
jgi:Raf kinase inhibitor-like YbhB/YbcL family protein